MFVWGGVVRIIQFLIGRGKTTLKLSESSSMMATAPQTGKLRPVRAHLKKLDRDHSKFLLKRLDVFLPLKTRKANHGRR